MPAGLPPDPFPMELQLGLFDGAQEPATVPVGPAPVPTELRAAAARLPRSLHLGTSSWSFPGWAGIVYDRLASETVLARHGLGAYASHPLLRTVGVDRTFYRSIPAAEFRAMADAVPGDFRFLVKADRLLTSVTDPGEGTLRLPLHGVEHGGEAGPLRALSVELGNRCEVQPRHDLRRQLAAGQNPKLRLVVRFGVRNIFGTGRRVESGDGRCAFVLDEHAGRRTVHRGRRERADGDGEQNQQEDGEDDETILINRVEAIEDVRVGIGGE